MNRDYLYYYRVLGVEPGCNWTTLRSAYRRLVRRWHPDSRPNDLSNRVIVEERIKEITIAYRELSEYRKRHGRLPTADPTDVPRSTGPDAEPSPAAHTDQSAASAPPSRPRDPAQRHRLGKSVSRMLLAGMLLAIVYAIARNIFDEAEAPRTARPAPAPVTDTNGLTATTRPAKSAPTAAPVFGVGSPVGVVYEVQGVPTRVDGDTWYYGESKVYFEGGLVRGWTEDLLHPLKVLHPLKAHEGANYASGQTAQRDFGVGSTKEEVRAVQGVPVIESESVWDYGLSKVYFDQGRVTGWSDSPMRPLKVRRQKPGR